MLQITCFYSSSRVHTPVTPHTHTTLHPLSVGVFQVAEFGYGLLYETTDRCQYEEWCKESTGLLLKEDLPVSGSLEPLSEIQQYKAMQPLLHRGTRRELTGHDFNDDLSGTRDKCLQSNWIFCDTERQTYK